MKRTNRSVRAFNSNRILQIGACLSVAIALPVVLFAQVAATPQRELARCIIVPQTNAYAVTGRATVQIKGVDVHVHVVEQVATTTMDIALHNPSAQRLEAELIVPVPDRAVVRGFTFQGAASEPTAELLPRDEARRIYDGIVSKLRDPALLEFAGYNLIRTSVFPVEAGGEQKVRLTYEQILPADSDRVDYVLPRSESLSYQVPWNITVKISSKRSISTVYSPSHPLDTSRPSASEVAAKISPHAVHNPGPFRLSYLFERGSVTATLFSYPEPVGADGTQSGHFLLLAGLPARGADSAAEKTMQREITLVLDRSGSMQGEKFQQARASALQVLEGIRMGETFNIIVYSDQVESFSPQPVVKTAETTQQARAFVERIQVGGGTNLHDALAEALRPKPAEGALPLVLFLTDGLPTVGQTSEIAIREVAIRSNPYNRRVFTFGVGFDVNTPLLERIADETRATTTIVLPGEDVEVKVSQVYRRLAGPILADGRLEAEFAGGAHPANRIREMLPSRLPDLFDGDQLVLLGRYTHDTADSRVKFRLSGNYRGEPKVFEFDFDLAGATVRNSFVPRLWASRKIGELVDAIRQLGADPQAAMAAAGSGIDPRLKELVDEVIRLSTQYGILTEYTAFLAREGTDLSRRDDVMAAATENFRQRAMNTRWGQSAVTQTFNTQAAKMQSCASYDNAYYDEHMNRVSITTVQQVCDRAYFHRNNRWVDSRIVEKESSITPHRVVEFGSEEYRTLVDRLSGEGRQGVIALRGEILMVLDGEYVLVRGPATEN